MKTVFITGASKGIGLATVDALLKNNCRVIAVYSSTEPTGEHENLIWVKIDLSETDKLESIFQNILSDYSPEIVINNAGVFRNSPFTKETNSFLKDWEWTFRVNVTAPVLISKIALEFWKEQKIEGRLINITSRAAYRAETEEFPAYGASKAALNNFTKTVARSYSKYGITAVNIAPGFVETDMAQEAIKLNGREALESQTSTGTIAQPEDIAELITFTALANTKHITGSTFHMNSGSYLI